MWTREEECKEIVELAWDPYRDDSVLSIQERIERCQTELQFWNQNNFDNIYKSLKQNERLCWFCVKKQIRKGQGLNTMLVELG